MTRIAFATALVLVLTFITRPAAAQPLAPLDLGIQIIVADSGQFDSTDVGVSGRLAWNPGRLVGLEGELAFYPSDFPRDGLAFSSQRFEGLFGATVGPRLGRIRPFGRGRTGFLAFSGAPEPFPCIAIFPPPVNCQLAAGQTLLALDFGGGLEVDATSKTFLRIDVGSRVVRYSGPVLDDGLRLAEDGFFSQDLRIGVGGGFRFGR